MSNLVANVTTDAIERQLNASRQESEKKTVNSTFDLKNYLNTRLKPGESSRKIKIRILPVSVDDNSFWLEVKTHALKVDPKISESGFKNFICLDDKKNPKYVKGQRCPLCEKMFELFKAAKVLREKGETAQAQTLFDKAKTLRNKTSYIVRVIDRDHEDESVKFWKFNMSYKGEGVLDRLITLYQNLKESYAEDGKGDDYNIFNLENGRDIILRVKRQYDSNGNELPHSIQIDVDDKEKPLAASFEQMNAWIADPKRWFDVYSVKDVEYLSIIAEDEIPVRDSDTGHYIPWKNKDAEKHDKENAIAEGQKLLEQQPQTVVSPTPQPTVSTSAPVTVPQPIDDEDDLPF